MSGSESGSKSDSEPTWRGASPPTLSWQEGVPHSGTFEDSYFSHAGGPDESRHVFLTGNDLPARWGSDRFTIVETGFGTGLNFLTTWQDWRGKGRPCPLHFISVEAFPLTREDMAVAAESWPHLADGATALLQQNPPPLPGMHRLLFDEGTLVLDLFIGELDEALAALRELPGLAVNAWYLDGFAPSRNPDMWTDNLYQTMAQVSAAAASFATFTAAGHVRRGLADAGFEVNKAPGFGHKREMLRGTLAAPGTRSNDDTPWQLPRYRYPAAEKGELLTAPEAGPVAVLGSGLAGASAARALARRGYSVTVFDAGPLAGGASGNPQGALYTRISHRASALNSFSLHSFSYASRMYRDMLERGELDDGELCGALHLRPDWGPEDPLFETVSSLPGLVRGLSASEAEDISGIPGCPGGLYYPDSGWMHPPAVCRSLLNHPGITVHTEQGNLSLKRGDSGWTLSNDKGPLFTAAIVIVACGAATARVVGADWLRLQSIRGQTSQVPSRGGLAALKTVLCHEGYLPPARAGEHCLGATFDIEDPDIGLRDEDHTANLDQVRRALPTLATDLADMDVSALTGRVGFRCASPDYLPIVGPVPDAEAFCDDYAPLRRNARQRVDRTGSYLEGLYISTGHGSRGLTSTPLSAELLAAQISGEAWPMPASLAQALAPARFLIRDLIRNRR